MSRFDVHTTDTAPAAAKPLLESAQAKYGFLPNLLGVMAESPALLEAYMAAQDVFRTKTELTPTEQEIVLLTVAVTNGCEYCASAHTAIGTMGNVPADVLNAVRDDRPIADAKLEALRQYTAATVRERGWVGGSPLDAFLAAGYTKRQAFDVINGVGVKTMSNYMNHVADTPLDEQFAGAKWEKPANAVV